MENEETLERKGSMLDKDHTRLRSFVFRIGMAAVVTENGIRKRVRENGSVTESTRTFHYLHEVTADSGRIIEKA